MQTAQAGSLESGDVLVDIRRSNSSGVSVQLSSPVKAQFGEAILRAVNEALATTGVSCVELLLKDRGALDYVIRARVRTAAERLLAAEKGAS